MAFQVTWTGLEELKAQLRALPRELVDEASGIVLRHAEAAKADIAQAYPARTGTLRDRLYLAPFALSAFGTGVEIGNRAPHAHLFEYGTETRQTAIGANRGRMPPGNVFVPRVIRHRQAMYAALADMLVTHGLEVSGAGGMRMAA